MRILTMIIALMLVGQVSAQNVGQEAPDFTLTNVDGGTFTLSEQSGKVVFIFTFGNTCSHCIANGPNTESGIYNAFKDNEAFVAVGIDAWDGTSGQVQSFRASTAITYPLLLDGSDMVSAYNTTYDRMIVVDETGVVRYKSSSNATTSVVASAHGVIENLLSTSGVSNVEDKRPSLESRFILGSNQLFFNNPYGVSGLAEYTVMDISGRVLQRGQVLLEDENSVDLSANGLGLHFVTISDGQQMFTSKFIK